MEQEKIVDVLNRLEDKLDIIILHSADTGLLGRGSPFAAYNDLSMRLIYRHKKSKDHFNVDPYKFLPIPTFKGKYKNVTIEFWYISAAAAAVQASDYRMVELVGSNRIGVTQTDFEPSLKRAVIDFNRTNLASTHLDKLKAKMETKSGAGLYTSSNFMDALYHAIMFKSIIDHPAAVPDLNVFKALAKTELSQVMKNHCSRALSSMQQGRPDAVFSMPIVTNWLDTFNHWGPKAIKKIPEVWNAHPTTARLNVLSKHAVLGELR